MEEKMRHDIRILSLVFCLILFPAISMAVDNVAKMTIHELKTKMDRGDNIFIIDVRAEGLYEESDIKIKNAVRIPFADIKKRAHEILMGSEVVTYCS